MKNYKYYKGHKFEVKGSKKLYDTTIYTLDIETSSYIILDGEVLPAIEYENLSKKEQERSIKQSCMYIWQFSINDEVYYGRTWDELIEFLEKLNKVSKYRKYIFIHNLAFEFQFLKNYIPISEVIARTKHKPMKAISKKYNIEFRCSYMMSNCALAKLPKLFNLPVKKMVGDLDYSKIRTSETPLTRKELRYCEYDCLVVYEYIKYELLSYEDVKHIPITSTGHVRRELKELVRCNTNYKRKIAKATNTNPIIFDLLVQTYAGGYTHSNYVYTDYIVENVTSWDFTSSYPYCLCCFKYPMTKFQPIEIKRAEEMLPSLAYLLRVRFKGIHSKYLNNFISKSKCLMVSGSLEDNGRIVSANELEIAITDVDFRILLEAYEYESYEILESYYSVYKYLPKEFINFILDKYVKKTKYKNDKEHELEYSKEKSLFNALYGMTVTNTIRPQVDFINNEWIEIPMTVEEMQEALDKREKEGFLEFSTGVWCTSYARANLQRNIMKLDKYQVYADTDSIKVVEGYDESVIEEYNKDVLDRLRRVSEELNIPLEKFMPEDIKGIPHPLGVFDNDGIYKEFITQGAKKYAYKTVVKKSKFKSKEDIDKYRKSNSLYIVYEDEQVFEEIHITVSGVPKRGVACLKGDLSHFKNDLVFDYRNTNKNTLLYCEGQLSIELEDYLGNTSKVTDTSGICILPTTYILDKAEDYMTLLEDSTERQLFKNSK